MWGAAANHLSFETARELAAYVASLDAKAANDGRRVLIATGQTLYREGSPATNIPSCVACHGPHAEGFEEIPRLGGLSYHYLQSRLEQWGEGYHSTAAAPMPEVASKLSPDEIDALASYLSFLY
jgi:cytochrome c553